MAGSLHPWFQLFRHGCFFFPYLRLPLRVRRIPLHQHRSRLDRAHLKRRGCWLVRDPLCFLSLDKIVFHFFPYFWSFAAQIHVSLFSKSFDFVASVSSGLKN